MKSICASSVVYYVCIFILCILSSSHFRIHLCLSMKGTRMLVGNVQFSKALA